MSKLIDLTGNRYGRLIVVGRAEDRIQSNGRHRVFWKCHCDCGKDIEVLGDNLKQGRTTSCGCYSAELISKLRSTHRETKTKLYGVWCAIKTRCYNPHSTYYNRYGGRGVYMCDEWKNDFTAFRDWAHKNGYNEGLSIDRIDNDRGYFPDNCRWVDAKTQANNRSSNRVLTLDGVSHNVTEWARMLDINPKTLFNRVYEGKSVEDVLRAN